MWDLLELKELEEQELCILQTRKLFLKVFEKNFLFWGDSLIYTDEVTVSVNIDNPI